MNKKFFNAFSYVPIILAVAGFVAIVMIYGCAPDTVPKIAADEAKAKIGDLDWKLEFRDFVWNGMPCLSAVYPGNGYTAGLAITCDWDHDKEIICPQYETCEPCNSDEELFGLTCEDLYKMASYRIWQWEVCAKDINCWNCISQLAHNGGPPDVEFCYDNAILKGIDPPPDNPAPKDDSPNL
ncbi:MAG: hypothetical protein GTO24_21265 [candidate division Zixibacteria bacterium]|nr:hypothetical protein [candidate division Zixibacteria bacterium]